MNKTQIMVVEDERIVALNLKQRLTRMGYEVTAVVTSGERALAAIKANPPDIVLMDIHIDGDMDGIDTAAAIPSELNVPVVYLTAYAEEATLDRARHTRPYGYLLKPFSERELHATMQMVLERRKADVLLRESEANLEHLVAERTAQLASSREELYQLQKMEAIGQLTGGVAHDFNNLLTPIIGSLDLLQRRGVGGEREQRMIAGALASAERAKVVVQRLLAFSRRQPLQACALDIGELLDGMTDLLTSGAGPGISVVIDVQPGIPAVHADANQLEMAILNLGVNARDAMPEGGSLTITAVRETAEPEHPNLAAGEYVRLAVQDTGEGMAPETLSRAIEPFYSTKGVGKGTGLGLSMVHGLISQLGGAMKITSAPGEGVTVSLWLPVSSDAVQPITRHLAGVELGEYRGKALLVDDEDLARDSTAEMLKELGYEVVQVCSALEALSVLGAGEVFDLVLTDHIMPGMSGADLVHRLRETYPELRSLIISGYADVDGIAPDLPRLTKPFRHAELAESLASLASTAPGERRVSQDAQ